MFLKVNDKPTLDGAREVLVQTLSSEARLRHLAWIEKNRKQVDEATGGKVGYVYVPIRAAMGSPNSCGNSARSSTRPG